MDLKNNNPRMGKNFMSYNMYIKANINNKYAAKSPCQSQRRCSNLLDNNGAYSKRSNPVT